MSKEEEVDYVDVLGDLQGSVHHDSFAGYPEQAMNLHEIWARCSTKNPYVILGLEYSTPRGIVKTTLQGMIKSVHPDVIKKKGGTIEDINLAGKVIQEVLEAERYLKKIGIL